MGATRALLDSAGESEASTSARRAVRLLREDANADFPSADQVAPTLRPAEPAMRSVEPTTGEATGVQLESLPSLRSLRLPLRHRRSSPPRPVRASAPARRMSVEMELPRGRSTGGGGGAAEKRSERRPAAAKAPPPGSPGRRAGPLTEPAASSAPDPAGMEMRSASSTSTPVQRHEETQPAFRHELPGGPLQRRLAALDLSVPMMLLVALLGALLLAGLGAIFFMGGEEALETKQALADLPGPAPAVGSGRQILYGPGGAGNSSWRGSGVAREDPSTVARDVEDALLLASVESCPRSSVACCSPVPAPHRGPPHRPRAARRTASSASSPGWRGASSSAITRCRSRSARDTTRSSPSASSGPATGAPRTGFRRASASRAIRISPSLPCRSFRRAPICSGSRARERTSRTWAPAPSRAR